MAADTTTSATPDFRFLVSHPAHFIALGFGSGLAPFAPGTFGTLASWGLYALLALVLPPVVIAFLAVPLFFLGVWACDVTSRHLGTQDHGAIVWDEIVAFLPLAALAQTPFLIGLVFVVFRMCDIIKPWPVGVLDKRVKGGFGVMLDDAAAAALTAAVFIPLHILIPE
jgi:phosphatidylglycerophosphatase A